MPVPVFTTNKIDAFATLGVPYDASPDEIKLAYKKLALRWHPDRHLYDKDTATQKFIEIHDAYRALTTPDPPPAAIATDAAPPSHPKKSPSPRHAPAPAPAPAPDEPPAKKTPPPRYRKVSEDPKPSPPPHYERMPSDDHNRGTRYATMPDGAFPKQSPGARFATMPEERSPGPRFATMPAEHYSSAPGPAYAYAGVPEETARAHKRSPGPKHAAMPPEEQPSRAGKRSPGPKYAAMPGEHRPSTSKKSPGPKYAAMPEEKRAHAHKRSPGPKYAAMPPPAEEQQPRAGKRSPGPRFAAMPGERRSSASKKSPGPRYAAMPGEHPSSSSKRSPGPRYAAMPGEHHSKRSPGPRYATMADEPMYASAKRSSPGARFASMPDTTPPVTPSFRPAKLRKERSPRQPPPPPSPSRRHSDTHVPPYTPSAHSHSDPGHDRSHHHHHPSPRKAPESEFSDYVEIKHHDVPLGDPLTPHRARDVRDWVFPLELTLEELYQGTTQRFRITQPPGPSASHTHPRTTTHAPTSSSSTIAIVVPPGTAAGARVAAVPGVVFEVREVPHTYYRRVESDLLMCVEIPWSGLDEAEMRGGQVCFVGLGGEDIVVPMPESLADATRGTCVKGKGMPVSRGGSIVEYGDLYIRWDFFVPGKATPSSKWSTLKKAMNFRL